MNTANLQLEGLYAVIAALTAALRDKGVLTEDEIDTALGKAEVSLDRDEARDESLSPANREALRFPIRYLRHVNKTTDFQHRLPPFSAVASTVGRVKDGE